MSVNITLPIFLSAVTIPVFAILTFFFVKNKIRTKIYVGLHIVLLLSMLVSIIKINEITFTMFVSSLWIILFFFFTHMLISKKIKKDTYIFLIMFITLLAILSILFSALSSLNLPIECITLPAVFIFFILGFLLFRRKGKIVNFCLFGFLLSLSLVPAYYRVYDLFAVVIFMAILYIGLTLKKYNPYELVGMTSLFFGILYSLMGLSAFGPLPYFLGYVSSPTMLGYIGVSASIIPIASVLQIVKKNRKHLIGLSVVLLSMFCFVVSVFYHYFWKENFFTLGFYKYYFFMVYLGVTFAMLSPALIIHQRGRKNFCGIGCALLPIILFMIGVATYTEYLLMYFLLFTPQYSLFAGQFALLSGILTNNSSKHIEA